MIALALGSNLGDRLLNLRRALHRLDRICRVVRVSSIYETDALCPPGAPASWNLPYLNCVALVDSDSTPLELLDRLQAIERHVGRTPSDHWAPRVLDLDILAGEVRGEALIYRDSRLEIPHARMLDRSFVLVPLAEVWPDWRCPVEGEFLGRTAKELATRRAGLRRFSASFTELIGILNVTPDSFSDGGLAFEPTVALERAKQLITEGASRVDVGAESTRPGAASLTPEEEWSRLFPVAKGLRESGIPWSVDTRHAGTAAQAASLGCDWINDVEGFASEKMREVAAASGASCVVMHSLTVPPSGRDVLPGENEEGWIRFLLDWADRRFEQMVRAGIDPERILFDPGIGFGKTPAQSWAILRNIHRFHALGVRLFVGHSRKSFLKEIAGGEPADRDVETAVLSAGLAKKGVDYLRLHDVRQSVRAIRALERFSGVLNWGE